MAADSTGCIPDLTRTPVIRVSERDWRVADMATDTLMTG